MPKKIIVVDDSSTIRQQVAMVLQEAGYAVVEAVDGIEGLEAIARNPDAAMVICDLNMPRMDGLAMLTKVKEGGTRPALPIVMLTTEGQKSMLDQAKQAGAKAWLVKPFKPTLLVAAVTKLAGAA